jgi:hypothetical protein
MDTGLHGNLLDFVSVSGIISEVTKHRNGTPPFDGILSMGERIIDISSD